MFSKRLIVFILFFCLPVAADVKLPSLISDNMVIQQDEPFTIWGCADPNEYITVKFQDKFSELRANAKGKWFVELPAAEAGGPFEIVIKGKNEIKVSNILAGQVWLCSGQSNMEMPVFGWRQKGHVILNSDEEIKNANYPEIRLFHVEKNYSEEPLDNCNGCWRVCSPETVREFSATAYFFGREIHKRLNVPVGLIHSSWGGSAAQAWISKEVLQSDADFKLILQNAELKKPKVNKAPYGLYNGMLYPLKDYNIKGVIWYQGESNVSQAHLYRKLFAVLTQNWRKTMNQGNFPFYYVQIAPWNYKERSSPLLREAQMLSTDIDNVGMAVTLDIGDDEIIHPANKQQVGRRLALWALAKTYGIDGIVFSGPIYKSMKIEGNSIRLFFDYIDRGLVAKDSQLVGFEIAGSDKKFVPANAIIQDDTILVSAEGIESPVAVRYAWSNTPKASLFNKAGLPASSFRTDDWQIE